GGRRPALPAGRPVKRDSEHKREEGGTWGKHGFPHVRKSPRLRLPGTFPSWRTLTCGLSGGGRDSAAQPQLRARLPFRLVRPRRLGVWSAGCLSAWSTVEDGSEKVKWLGQVIYDSLTSPEKNGKDGADSPFRGRHSARCPVQWSQVSEIEPMTEVTDK